MFLGEFYVQNKFLYLHSQKQHMLIYMNIIFTVADKPPYPLIFHHQTFSTSGMKAPIFAISHLSPICMCVLHKTSHCEAKHC